MSKVSRPHLETLKKIGSETGGLRYNKTFIPQWHLANGDAVNPFVARALIRAGYVVEASNNPSGSRSVTTFYVRTDSGAKAATSPN